ncbi:uncharacterized protein [Leptinotarsa decemlineata]|uniref:uncharacterized protein n=1 Tax=Leptinotarsa decemlineata TaxID=7539 RepID=UPI003D305439
MDYNVLRTLSEYMNFTLEFDEDKGVYFGSVLANGSATGSLGKIVRGEVDMGGNHRFIEDLGSADYQHTLPSFIEDLCIVVHKAGSKPRWLAILGCFKWEVWLCILITYVICAISWSIRERMVEKDIDYTKAHLEIFAIAFSIPVKVKIRSKFILSVCLYLNIITVSIFQGNYIKSLNIVQYYKEIDTLEEFIHSGYQISTSLVNIFDGIDSVIYSKLKERIIDSSDADIPSLYRTASSTNIAALLSKRNAEMFEKTIKDSEGNPVFHMVKQCPVTHLYGYLLRKNSPFIPKINAILQKLKEGGWMSKWLNDDYQYNLVDRVEMEYRHDFEFKGLDLSGIQIAIYILIVGTVLSVVVFCMELLWWRIIFS